jgi:hypothetical protein
MVEIKCNFAGVKLCRKNRLTDRVMTTYVAEVQGIDTDGEPYAVVCEEHGAIVGVRSLQVASACIAVADFCEDCRAELDEAEAATDGGEA